MEPPTDNAKELLLLKQENQILRKRLDLAESVASKLDKQMLEILRQLQEHQPTLEAREHKKPNKMPSSAREISCHSIQPTPRNRQPRQQTIPQRLLNHPNHHIESKRTEAQRAPDPEPS